MQSSAIREQELFILEAAYAASDDCENFAAILIWIELPDAYLDTLKEVIKKRRWHKAASPKDSLRQAVYRAVFRKEGRPARRAVKYVAIDESDLEAVAESAFSGDAYVVAGSGTWRQGRGIYSDPCAQRYYVDDEIYVPGVTNMPSELVRKLTPTDRGDPDKERIVDDVLIPNWEAIARAAGLDQWESQAISFMGKGAGLHVAQKTFESNDDKRHLAAAWKRLQRSGFAKIKDALKKV
jgi:hypothetical protein